MGLDGNQQEMLDDFNTCLAGPEDDNEWYWEAWDSILCNYQFNGSDGNTYTLHQDGDLWAVRSDMTEKEWTQFTGN